MSDAMLPRGKLPEFRKRLLDWFRQFQREMPWRKIKDPYRIWLSEIMLQQTRVAAAIPYYERFLERFPDIRALASAPEEEVLRLWSGLGYYSRARNLQKAARKIVVQHAGRFPNQLEDVLELPGVGNYTAAAVLSIAFEEKFAVLDGNVARVLARLEAIRGEIGAPRRWKKLQETADRLLDEEAPGDWNQAMMELGATLCSPKSPQCLICPVAQFCEGRKQGIAESLPQRRKERDQVEVTLAAAVFVDAKGRTLLLPPPKSASKNGTADDVPTLVSRMWHFPTVSVSGDPAVNLQTLLRSILGKAESRTWKLEPSEKVRHAVTYRAITVLPFRIAVRKLSRTAGGKLIPLDEISTLPVSNLTRKVALSAREASKVVKAASVSRA